VTCSPSAWLTRTHSILQPVFVGFCDDDRNQLDRETLLRLGGFCFQLPEVFQTKYVLNSYYPARAAARDRTMF
jgi:hypothetical protein